MKENNERDDVETRRRLDALHARSWELISYSGAPLPRSGRLGPLSTGRSYAPPPRPLCSFVVSNDRRSRSIYQQTDPETPFK